MDLDLPKKKETELWESLEDCIIGACERVGEFRTQKCKQYERFTSLKVSIKLDNQNLAPFKGEDNSIIVDIVENREHVMELARSIKFHIDSTILRRVENMYGVGVGNGYMNQDGILELGFQVYRR